VKVDIVVKVKEMPYDEKYKRILDSAKLLETIALPIVKEDIGDKKAAELKSTWQKQSENIPESASVEEKYEVAFHNLLRNFQSAYDVINDKLGERGTEKLINGWVKELERQTGGSSLYLYKFIRAIAPQTAFRTAGKQIAYQFQFVTPYSIPELTGQRMVMDIPSCKFLDVEGCDAPCEVVCQKITPLWLKEQFKIKNSYERKEGKSCIATFTPI
jgi:hypothetical protein